MNSIELAKRIRLHSINMVNKSSASHIGSILSIIDIVAVLYNDIMNLYPSDAKNINRDRFVLSKGHAGVAIYATLAEKGFFATEKLKEYYTDGSCFSGHVSHKGVAGVEFSTGSLGMGVSVASGMALALKLNNLKSKVFTIVGDGECNEGSVWETAQFASHFKLNNFTVIIDNNNLQGLGRCENVLNPYSLADKWQSFGWNVIETDGHNHECLHAAFIAESDKPKCIIAKTIKGKGVSFMENSNIWHYRDPKGQDYINAIKEIEQDKL